MATAQIFGVEKGKRNRDGALHCGAERRPWNFLMQVDEVHEPSRDCDPVAGWRPQLFAHVVTDGEQIDRLNHSGGIAVDFARVPKSPVHLAFSGGQSRTLCIWTTSSHHGFRSTPKISADLFTLRFVTNGSLVRHNMAGEDVVSRVDFGTFVDFEDMRDEQASSTFSAVSATLSQGTILKASVALNGEEPKATVRFAPFVELKTAGLLALRQTLSTLHGWLTAGPQELDLVAPMLEELVVYQLIGAWPLSAGSTPLIGAASGQAYRRAMDYMEANLNRQMTMQEIASAAGTTVRALQLAFKREVGRSPIAWLIDRRLDRVRQSLLDPQGQSIRQIAMRWGFVHMSDFGRRFRERFGHSPSAAGNAR